MRKYMKVGARRMLGVCAMGGALAAAMALAPAARAQYCAAGSDSCGTAFNDERISRVVFGSIDNSSGTGDGPAGCYSDFTSITTTVFPGQSYTFTVYNAGVYAPDQGTVWIDWNQDFTFGDVSSGEQVNLTQSGGGAVFSGTVTVPVGATLGTTRLRVRVMYTGTPSPCDSSAYGEVEDYTVTVAAPTTGACCTGGGACAQTTQAACTGAFQGLASSCAPNPCGGACCSTSGACTVTTAATCTGAYIDHAACTAASCQYCTAGSSTCGTAFNDERISEVILNTIDNVSGAGEGPAGCYSDFTTISTNLFPGQSYAITVSNAGAYTEDQAAVWVDWNRDFVFGDEASGEQVTLLSDGTGAVFTGTVTVPAGTTPGSVRMRVRVMYTGTLSPCGGSDYGEVEDYSIFVVSPTTGACCAAAGSCTSTAPGACSGVFQGLATSCTPSNPCGGACCTAAGACTVTTAAGCVGGSYLDHGTCTATVCSGSCCDASGACNVVPTASCTGTFGGLNSSCNGNPCAGACCSIAAGTCAASTVAGCPAGSTFQSVGTSCTPNPCPQPPPPANDECSAATVATIGTQTGGNVFATVSVTLTNDASNPLCTQATWGAGAQNDVFWRFTAPATADYSVDTCGSSFDTILAIHSACPVDQSNLVSCNDDSTSGAGNMACSSGGLQSHIPHVTLTAGTTYYIRVFGYAGATGAITLTINPVNSLGSCCSSGSCTSTDSANCSGTYTDGASCTPNPCSGGGLCCRGSTCSTAVANAAACTGSLIPGQLAGAVFIPGAACNVSPISSGPCCYANYNKVNGISVQDIFDFLADWFAGSRYANTGGNGAPAPLAVQNIFDFLTDWFSGGCS